MTKKERRARRTRSAAWRAGYKDGLAWDLDGYTTENRIDREGWDDATLNAIGPNVFGQLVGCKPGSKRFDRACVDYNAGAYAGATATGRTGLPPREC